MTPLSNTVAKSPRIRSIGPLDSFRNMTKLLRLSMFCQMIVTSKSSCATCLAAIRVTVAWAGDAVYNYV